MDNCHRKKCKNLKKDGYVVCEYHLKLQRKTYYTGEQVEIICLTCNKKFKRLKAVIRRRPNKVGTFCSHACYSKHLGRIPGKKRTKEYDITGRKYCKGCKSTMDVENFFSYERNGSRICATLCKECHNTQSKLRQKTARLNVIKYYTKGKMKCSNCRESRIECLDIDHVNNDGVTERKKIKYLNGSKLYNKIIKEDYPDSYQVLCKNCNWLKYLKFKGWIN